MSFFYTNYGFYSNIFSELQNTRLRAQLAVVKIEKLKELHEFLFTELKFLIERIVRYINKSRSAGLDFKERSKIYLLRKNIKTRRNCEKLDFKKFGLFLINKKIREDIYRLKLLKDIKIYSVFYILLLESIPDNVKF